jgi:hypothetical protein
MATKAKAKASPPAEKREDDLEELLGKPKASNSQMAEIGDLCEEAIKLQTSIDNLEEAVKGYKVELNAILATKLPTAMMAANMSSFSTTDGTELMLKDILSGSLPKEDLVAREAAIKWLRANGARDLIKAKLEAVFNQGDNKTVIATKAALKSLKVPFNIKEDVHPQSLSAYARQRLQNGEEVPLALLGLYSGKIAQIKSEKADTKTKTPKQPKKGKSL